VVAAGGVTAGFVAGGVTAGVGDGAAQASGKTVKAITNNNASTRLIKGKVLFMFLLL
jgi:hypothetical protein